MDDKRISQLDTANNVVVSDYIIVDNTEVTKRATVGSLSSIFAFKTTVDDISDAVNRLDGSLVNVVSLSGATYKLQQSNLGAYIRKYHTSSHTIVIPNFSEVPFQVGSTFIIRNTSSSTLTISGDSNITLSYFTDLSANILDESASAQIVCVGTDNWDII
jgi:hypothetical protein